MSGLSEDQKKAIDILVTRASKEAMKAGMIKVTLPPSVASGVADQLFFAVELLKKGPSITPKQLGVALVGKGLGILKISSQGQWDCGIAIATVIYSIVKASSAGPASFLLQAASLLYDCYSMDKSCGISAAAEAKIRKTMEPVAIWLDNGVREALSRQSF